MWITGDSNWVSTVGDARLGMVEAVGEITEQWNLGPQGIDLIRISTGW